MGIVDSLPSNWRSVIKGNIFREALQFDENCIQLRIKGELVDLTSTTSKLLYKEFCSHKATPPTAQAKLEDKHPNCSFNWKKIYSLAFSVTLDTKLRAFQYKLLNRIVFTNDKLFRFNIVESPLCTFCTVDEESLEHLLFFCEVTELFWKEILSWLARCSDEAIDFLITEVLFGKFDRDNDFMVINHLILLAKFFIYRCKLDKIIPSFEVFKAKLKATRDLELFIARKNNSLLKHYSKWESLALYL